MRGGPGARQLRKIERYYRRARTAYEKAGRTLVDATPNGSCTVFRKVASVEAALGGVWGVRVGAGQFTSSLRIIALRQANSSARAPTSRLAPVARLLAACRALSELAIFEPNALRQKRCRSTLDWLCAHAAGARVERAAAAAGAPPARHAACLAAARLPTLEGRGRAAADVAAVRSNRSPRRPGCRRRGGDAPDCLGARRSAFCSTVEVGHSPPRRRDVVGTRRRRAAAPTAERAARNKLAATSARAARQRGGRRPLRGVSASGPDALAAAIAAARRRRSPAGAALPDAARAGAGGEQLRRRLGAARRRRRLRARSRARGRPRT